MTKLVTVDFGDSNVKNLLVEMSVEESITINRFLRFLQTETEYGFMEHNGIYDIIIEDCDVQNIQPLEKY